MTESFAGLLRQIPSVSEFLSGAAGAALSAEFGQGVVKLELRRLLDELRAAIRDGELSELPGPEALAERLRARLLILATPDGRRAVNATGIVLHTGLGRAPLCEEALAALAGCGRYSVVQVDPETGGRTLREEKVERMLAALVGCEAATVVNNNAAATMLILNTLAGGREVIVSRGQLIEIGGSFRMPEVMAKSGAIMREVGSTNRTHLADYEAALGENTGAIIHVHTSNYRVRGFAGTPDVGELCRLAKKSGLPVIDDLGSGALVSLKSFGLADEPLVADSVAAGAEAVCFSGDKLICGPQSGIICGRRETVRRIRKNPFARTFRVGKLTLAALEATLVHFLNGDYREKLPFYRALDRSAEELSAAAGRLAAALETLPETSVSIREADSFVGSGSLPDQGMPSRAVAVSVKGLATDELARRLRTGTPAVFGRVKEDELLLDLRTVFPDEIDLLAGRVKSAISSGDSQP